MLLMQRSVELENTILNSFFNHNHTFNKHYVWLSTNTMCGLKKYFNDTYVPITSVINVKGGCNLRAE